MMLLAREGARNPGKLLELRMQILARLNCVCA